MAVDRSRNENSGKSSNSSNGAASDKRGSGQSTPPAGAPLPPVPAYARETGTNTKPRLPLPHDRDESAADSGHPKDPVIEQAGKDVDRGLRDTDLRDKAGEAFDRKFGPRREGGEG